MKPTTNQKCSYHCTRHKFLYQNEDEFGALTYRCDICGYEVEWTCERYDPEEAYVETN